ncbi:MAG: hypothetical protein K0A90_00175 [Methanosarcinaceae archaeon]|nr:hypothetical protein [Methanosarcinaceae archaeon]
MVDFSININDKEMLTFIDKKLDEIVDEIFANSQEIIISKRIVDEGTLLKSGNINRGFLEKSIVYPVPYADTIEFGRLPGDDVPIETIKAWLRRKGFVKGEKNINTVAYFIVKNIKKNGQEPRPFLSPAVEMVRNKIMAI